MRHCHGFIQLFNVSIIVTYSVGRIFVLFTTLLLFSIYFYRNTFLIHSIHAMPMIAIHNPVRVSHLPLPLNKPSLRISMSSSALTGEMVSTSGQ